MSTDLPPVDPKDTGPAPQPQPKLRPRMAGWARVLLVGSLALNLAVAGLVVGVILNGGPPEGRRPAPQGAAIDGVRDIGLGQFGTAFEREDRREIRRLAREKGPEVRKLRRELRGSFNELIPLLRADSFDAEAVQAVLARQRATASDIHMTAHTIVTDYLATMPAAERAALADRLEDRLKRGPKKNKPRKED